MEYFPNMSNSFFASGFRSTNYKDDSKAEPLVKPASITVTDQSKQVHF